MKKKLNKFEVVGESIVIKLNSIIYRKKFAIIDKEDFDKIKDYTWSVAYTSSIKDFFIAISNVKGKMIYMHRLILSCPDKCVIKHRNKHPNTLDNRKINLYIQSKGRK